MTTETGSWSGYLGLYLCLGLGLLGAGDWRRFVRNIVLVTTFITGLSECGVFLSRGFQLRNSLQPSLIANFNVGANLEMTVDRYGKTDPRSSLFKGAYESNPQETSRLLEDCARITDETEEIGERTVHEMRNQRYMIDETGRYLASMKDLARSARASIRQIQDKIRRKAICLWVVIITLFLANVAVILTLVQNHGKLLVYDA